MTLSILTKDDLLALDEKLNRILELLTSPRSCGTKEWLKSVEVKAILKCSDAALKTYRDSGRLPYTKIGGTYYYAKSCIDSLFEQKP